MQLNSVDGEIPLVVSPTHSKIGPFHQDQHEDNNIDLDALLKLERLKEKELTEIEKDEMGKEEVETGEVN
jgi:hypothetical protein